MIAPTPQRIASNFALIPHKLPVGGAASPGDALHFPPGKVLALLYLGELWFGDHPVDLEKQGVSTDRAQVLPCYRAPSLSPGKKNAIFRPRLKRMSERFISYADKIRCLEWELAFRPHVHARQVQTGRMTQAKADSEIAAMEAILADIKDLAEAG